MMALQILREIRGKPAVKKCKHGHPQTAANVYTFPNGKYTYCRICVAGQGSNWYQRNREKVCAAKRARREGSMTPEGKLKAEVQDFLGKLGMFYMRLQSGQVKVRGGFMHLCPTGTADLVVYPSKGFSVGWIEMKQLKGVQRKSQVEFQAKAEAAGHPYLVARSAEDVAKWLKENEAI